MGVRPAATGGSAPLAANSERLPDLLLDDLGDDLGEDRPHAVADLVADLGSQVEALADGGEQGSSAATSAPDLAAGPRRSGRACSSRAPCPRRSGLLRLIPRDPFLPPSLPCCH